MRQQRRWKRRRRGHGRSDGVVLLVGSSWLVKVTCWNGSLKFNLYPVKVCRVYVFIVSCGWLVG